MPTQPTIFTDDEWDDLAESLSLSPRQFEVIRHLFDGASDQQIADRMSLQLPTVRSHLARMFTKYDADDRVELILHVFRSFREMNGHQK